MLQTSNQITINYADKFVLWMIYTLKLFSIHPHFSKRVEKGKVFVMKAMPLILPNPCLCNLLIICNKNNQKLL